MHRLALVGKDGKMTRDTAPVNWAPESEEDYEIARVDMVVRLRKKR